MSIRWWNGGCGAGRVAKGRVRQGREEKMEARPLIIAIHAWGWGVSLDGFG